MYRGITYMVDLANYANYKYQMENIKGDYEYYGVRQCTKCMEYQIIILDFNQRVYSCDTCMSKIIYECKLCNYSNIGNKHNYRRHMKCKKHLKNLIKNTGLIKDIAGVVNQYLIEN